MDSLFGVEVTGAARFIIAFVVVLALIAVTAWLVRRFGSGALSSSGGRGRQPRLAVIDAATVDTRRKLILVRRDNVEHLVMIGGPSDVVIESNIVRAAAAREAAAGRAAPIPDTMPRPVPLEEGTIWPQQPEATPRPQRQTPSVAPAAAATQLSPAGQEQLDVSVRAHHPETLAELADTLAAHSPPRAEPRSERSPPAAPEQGERANVAATADEQSLAEMAQRLEAVLRRPGSGEPTLDVPLVESPGEPSDLPSHSAPDVPEAAHPTVPEVRPVTPEQRPTGETRKFYETLEEEMASLLGRPTGKT